MNEQEARKVISASRQIMRGLNKYTPWRTEDAEAELLLWAMENKETLQPYLSYREGETIPEAEQAAVLYTILRRHAWRLNNKLSSKEEEESHNHIYPLVDERFTTTGRLQGTPPVTTYNAAQLKDYLHYLGTPLEEVPVNKREQVNIMQAGYYTCTPGQQEILKEVARGKKLKTLAEERGEAYQKLKGLYKRGMNNIKRAFKGSAPTYATTSPGQQ